MKTINVIVKPILSEKAYKLMEKGLYTFLVDERAKKNEISKAVSKQYSISIDKVNVSRIHAKTRKIAKTRKTVNVGGGKKATVWVKKGQTISALLPKAPSAKTKSQKTGQSLKDKDVEKGTLEGKEG